MGLDLSSNFTFELYSNPVHSGKHREKLDADRKKILSGGVKKKRDKHKKKGKDEKKSKVLPPIRQLHKLKHYDHRSVPVNSLIVLSNRLNGRNTIQNLCVRGKSEKRDSGRQTPLVKVTLGRK
jgi:hypothetical protein